MTDCVVVVRPSLEVHPIGRIVVGDEVVGWIHYEHFAGTRTDVSYEIAALDRAEEYAARAIQLLVHQLALLGDRTVTLRIEPEHDSRGSAIAASAGFRQLGGTFERKTPPLIYSDGVVTIRRPRPDDLEADLAAKDDAQIDWLWQPGQREQWEAMTQAEQRAHATRTLATSRDAFETGPKWCFSVDSADADYVAYVDFDLANEHVSAGDANISYSSHPAHRGRGYVTRAVRLVARFIVEHTGARRAYLIIDADNVASLRVAHAVGAAEVGRWVNARGRAMIRHELSLPHGHT